MMFLRIVVALSMVVWLSACSGGGGDSKIGEVRSSSAPSLKSLYTDIASLHPSYFTKFGGTADFSIDFLISAEISHPDGVGALTRVYVENLSDNRFWDMLGGPSSASLSTCYLPEDQLFECLFYNSANPDRIQLNDWQLVIEDRYGNVLDYPFQFKLPGGSESVLTEFHYSEQYQGGIRNGSPALEAMEVSSNDLVFESHPGTQSFRIEFTTRDPRAVNYDLFFYDRSANEIASNDASSPSIQSTPIVTGNKVVLDLPWSELGLYENAQPEDINGLHIRLLDAPILWETETNAGVWFNHLAFSEYVTL